MLPKAVIYLNSLWSDIRLCTLIKHFPKDQRESLLKHIHPGSVHITLQDLLLKYYLFIISAARSSLLMQFIGIHRFE